MIKERRVHAIIWLKQVLVRALLLMLHLEGQSGPVDRSLMLQRTYK